MSAPCMIVFYDALDCVMAEIHHNFGWWYDERREIENLNYYISRFIKKADIKKITVGPYKAVLEFNDGDIETLHCIGLVLD